MVFNNQLLKDSNFSNNNLINTKLTNMLNINNNNNNSSSNTINNMSNMKNSTSNTKVNSYATSTSTSSSSTAGPSNANINVNSSIVNGATSSPGCNVSNSNTNSSFSMMVRNGGAADKKVSSNDDKKINLNALKNQDPFAMSILDTALRVAVYKFMSKKNEWKKLDVEGSLFLFERMVEPLHSFAVMNTLALNLFLQPITADLEFQDRNPFLLYKSSNDIFGIWFIDKEDCERIKTLIVKLTDDAKERRVKREQSKLTSATIASTSDQLNEQDKKLSQTFSNLITPISLLLSTPTSSEQQQAASNGPLNKLLLSPSQQISNNSCNNIVNNVNGENNTLKNETNSNKNNVDILDMLVKAQHQFNQSKMLEPTSHSTPGGLNTSTNIINMIAGQQTQHAEQPASFLNHLLQTSSNHDLFVNLNSQFGKSTDATRASNPLLKLQQSSPASAHVEVAAASSLSNIEQELHKASNPILKLLSSGSNMSSSAATSSQTLMSGSSSTTALNASQSDMVHANNSTGSESSHNLLSQELKRKLNIKAPSNASNLISPSVSLIATPSNPLILSESNNMNSGSLNNVMNSLLKRPITVQDFEENLLNQSVSAMSTPSSTLINNQQQQTSKMFYLPNTSNENLMYNKEMNAKKQQQQQQQNTFNQKLSIGSLTTTSISSVTSSSNSSSSTRSQHSADDTSSSESDESEPASPNTLPLLLTPAAFESSASSTTSSSYNNNNNNNNNQNANGTSCSSNHFFSCNNTTTNVNDSISLINKNTSYEDTSASTTTHSTSNQKLMTTTTANSSSSADLNSAELLMTPSVAISSKANATGSFESALLSGIDSTPAGNASLDKVSVLNKSQLQQALIHLLNTDDQFLTSLHQAYLKTNKTITSIEKKSTEGVKADANENASKASNTKQAKYQLQALANASNNKLNGHHHHHNHHHGNNSSRNNNINTNSTNNGNVNKSVPMSYAKITSTKK